MIFPKRPKRLRTLPSFPEGPTCRNEFTDHCRVLTDDDARRIRILYHLRGMRIPDLAAEFRVETMTIRQIVRGQTYRSAGGPHAGPGEQAPGESKRKISRERLKQRLKERQEDRAEMRRRVREGRSSPRGGF